MAAFGSVTNCASLHFLKISLHFRKKRGDSARETGSPTTGSSARESASNRCVFVVSSLARIVLKLPRVSAPANASAATRDAKCLGAGRKRPQGLSRPFSSRRRGGEAENMSLFGPVVRQVLAQSQESRRRELDRLSGCGAQTKRTIAMIRGALRISRPPASPRPCWAEQEERVGLHGA
jgi:hypothetical protein